MRKADPAEQERVVAISMPLAVIAGTQGTETEMGSKLLAIAVLLGIACGPAQAYIGAGVQGRPHAGNAPERMYADRHGIPYTGPRRHHLYGNPYRTHRYGR